MVDVQKMIQAKIPSAETGICVKKSVCTICDPQTQCGLDVLVKDGKIVRVEGSDENPYNVGSLCSKGAATRQYVYHKDRIQTPLKRVGPRGSGEFEPISWGEALDTIGDRLNAIKAEHGAESVVFFAGYTKYFRPFLSRLSRAFGSPNYCTESSTCFKATALAQKLVFGSGSKPDMPNTGCLVVWTANPFYTNPGNAKAILRNLERGMKMIVIDPRKTPTADRAHIHLQLRPGTDGALALAIANVIIAEKLYDAEFVENYTDGFEEYKNYVAQFSPERGEELTGVPAAKIRAAARMIAGAPSACVMPSASPVVHHTNGVQNYRAIFSIIALTGNFDIKGGNFVTPPSWLDVTSSFVTRQDEFMAPNKIGDLPPRVGAEQFPVWMEAATEEAQAMAVPEQLRTGKPYPLKAMVGFGMNHRMWPDSDGFCEALKTLDFFVTTDLFLTDTCKLADIVLPACTSLEREELRCYGMGYVLYSEKAIEPLYEARADVDIIYDLAARLCPDDELFKAGYDASMNWILEPSGMNLETLRAHKGGMFAPNPINPPERKYKNGVKTPSGKIEFVSKVLEQHAAPGVDALPVYHPPKYSKESTPELAAEYPLILNTGSRLPMFVHTRTYRLSWTSALRPNHPAVDINPADAKPLGLKQGDRVRIRTPKGAIEVSVNLTELGMPGVVHMYHGSAKADVNTLIDCDYLDPISGFPGFKSALCKLEKVDQVP